MNKEHLIVATAKLSGYPATVVRDVFDAANETIHEALAEGCVVRLFGIGKLYVSQRGQRKGRDMKTGASVVVPPSKLPMLRPSTSLVAAANGAPARG